MGPPGWLSWLSDFCSGHGFTVPKFEVCIRLTDVGKEPASDPLSPSLSAPAPLTHTLSLLKINK